MLEYKHAAWPYLYINCYAWGEMLKGTEFGISKTEVI